MKLFHGVSQRNTEFHGECMIENVLTSKVIKCAIEVHRALGPGLLESAYRECLFFELTSIPLIVEMEKPMPIIYKGVRLDHGYRMDLLVENKLVVENKTVEEFTEAHFAQVLTYLRLGNYKLGLLFNFQAVLLKEGLKRIIN